MNSLKDLHAVRWFRSAPVSPDFSAANIDAETGLIRDVVMVQEGPAEGHGVHLEEEFISALVAYDRKHFSRIGLKARFGHPSASSETMGTQLGVYSNFRKRRQGDKMQAIADLQVLDSAELSPTHPGMKSWVLSMAKERPDFIMSSIVFKGSALYQRKPNGHKHPLDEYGENYRQEYGNVYMEFDEEAGAEHYYTDLVEQGAATESLFSTTANPHLFVSKAHQFLDENPRILAYVQQHPEAVQAFLSRLGISTPTQKKQMSKPFSVWKWLSGTEQEAEPTTDDLDTLRDELEAAKEAVTGLKTERDALDNAVKNLSSQVDALQATVAQYKTDLEALKSDLSAKVSEIEALKAEQADIHTGGDTPPAAPAEKAYGKSPISRQVAAIRQKLSK